MADDALLGSQGFAGVNTDPTQSNQGPQPTGYVAPVEDPNGDATTTDERPLVAARWEEWHDAREFDKNFRQQVAIDRKYAAGTMDLTWAVSTNVIGAFIDILTSLLYARDPDVSVKKSAQVHDTGTQSMDMFARTLQIVISKLWKVGKLRHGCKKAVRSTLSVAEGWLKANMVAEKRPTPVFAAQLNDATATLERLRAQEQLIESPDGMSPGEIEAAIAEKEALIETLQQKIELAVDKRMVIDFVRAENIQVSQDVECVEDYLDANWIGNEIFVTRKDAMAMFPRLTEKDLKSAKEFFQHPPRKLTTHDVDNVLPQGELTAESALAFSSSQNTAESKPFLHVVEIWDRRDKHIYTIVEGVEKWAREPYTPPYPTSRFYPYFCTAFFEVDGERHPQSLSWRLYKLQDEYSTSRSNFRLTRERSIPGVLFNATMLSDQEAEKLQSSKIQEFTALKPVNPETPMADIFAPKPTAQVDMRLFDPTLIMNDMERVSGVQEALSAVQAGPGNPVTATEASIQQQGTNARTTSARDALEWMLTELAVATAEQALQALTVKDAMRYAGPGAFWLGPDPDNILQAAEPSQGMDVQDLFTMVDIDIMAGTTGKPLAKGDQAVWAQVMPLVGKTIMEIQQASGSGNQPVANALIELVQETMRRMGDDTDVSRFIPKNPPPGSPGAGGQPPPIVPKVTVALKGMVSPQAAEALVQPVVARDAPPPPNPAGPGGPPTAPGNGVIPPNAPAPGGPMPPGPAGPPPLPPSQ